MLTLHNKMGVVERKNRHLLEITQALCFQMNVPKFYWGEVILTFAYLINRLPSRVLSGVSPVQVLTHSFHSCPLCQVFRIVSLVVLPLSMFMVLIRVS